MTAAKLIYPNWHTPTGVFAFTSTRVGGVSEPPFDSLNIAQHVGDNPEHVENNRSLLPHSETITWLNQTHSNRCVEATSGDVDADASYTTQPGVTCAVMTADCLPILLCDKEATVVSAVHAGWRGLADGVIENTLTTLPCQVDRLMAWIGPAIGQGLFEVGYDVKSSFKEYQDAFIPAINEAKYLADLAGIARQKLEQAGVNDVFLSRHCTYSRKDLFFSHRRTSHAAGSATGRMVSAIRLNR